MTLRQPPMRCEGQPLHSSTVLGPTSLPPAPPHVYAMYHKADQEPVLLSTPRLCRRCGRSGVGSTGSWAAPRAGPVRPARWRACSQRWVQHQHCPHSYTEAGQFKIFAPVSPPQGSPGRTAIALQWRSSCPAAPDGAKPHCSHSSRPVQVSADHLPCWPGPGPFSHLRSLALLHSICASVSVRRSFGTTVGRPRWLQAAPSAPA